MTMSVKRLLFTFILLILLGLLAVPAAAWAGEAVQVVQTVTSTWTATGTLTPDDPFSTPEVTTTPGLEDIHTSTPQPTPTFIPTPTPTPIPIAPETGLPLVLPLFNGELPDDGYGPKDYPVYINPLTGLPVPDPALLDRRPIAVKITNYPRSVRPQSGLSLADLVFEYYMERGIPRFIAVFYGNDALKIGPIRSARLFDEHVFRMYDSYFAFGYADPRVREYFFRLGDDIVRRFVLESDFDDDVKCGENTFARLCRDPEIEGYNTMFGNTWAIRQYFEMYYGNNIRPDLTGMHFSTHVPPSVVPASIVKLRYSASIYNYWEYDPISSQYLRWQETDGYTDITMETYEPIYDALTGRRLSADNVVVLVVEHQYQVLHNTSDEVISMNLNGRGKAYVYRDGFAYEVEWVRPADGGVLTLYDMKGSPFPLRPGQTWFQVVSEETILEQNGQYWYFQFELPEVDPYAKYRINMEADPLIWFFRDQNPSLPWPGEWDEWEYE
jgi:hypothetical protein